MGELPEGKEGNQEWDQSPAERDSPWRLVQARVHVSLPAGADRGAARLASTQAYSRLLFRHHAMLGGVVVAHTGDVKIVSGPKYVLSSPFAHVAAETTLLLFAPCVGCKLVGTVIHVGPDHVGMSVHAAFHAVLPFGDVSSEYTYLRSSELSGRWHRMLSADGVEPLNDLSVNDEENSSLDYVVGARVRFVVTGVQTTRSGLYQMFASVRGGDVDGMLGAGGLGIIKEEATIAPVLEDEQTHTRVADEHDLDDVLSGMNVARRKRRLQEQTSLLPTFPSTSDFGMSLMPESSGFLMSANAIAPPSFISTQDQPGSTSPKSKPASLLAPQISTPEDMASVPEDGVKAEAVLAEVTEGANTMDMREMETPTLEGTETKRRKKRKADGSASQPGSGKKSSKRMKVGSGVSKGANEVETSSLPTQVGSFIDGNVEGSTPRRASVRDAMYADAIRAVETGLRARVDLPSQGEGDGKQTPLSKKLKKSGKSGKSNKSEKSAKKVKSSKNGRNSISDTGINPKDEKEVKDDKDKYGVEDTPNIDVEQVGSHTHLKREARELVIPKDDDGDKVIAEANGVSESRHERSESKESRKKKRRKEMADGMMERGGKINGVNENSTIGDANDVSRQTKNDNLSERKRQRKVKKEKRSSVLSAVDLDRLRTVGGGAHLFANSSKHAFNGRRASS